MVNKGSYSGKTLPKRVQERCLHRQPVELIKILGTTIEVMREAGYDQQIIGLKPLSERLLKQVTVALSKAKMNEKFINCKLLVLCDFGNTVEFVVNFYFHFTLHLKEMAINLEQLVVRYNAAMLEIKIPSLNQLPTSADALEILLESNGQLLSLRDAG